MTQNENERRTVRLLFWRLMPFLLLLYVVAYLDRINVGFAALQMKHQLGFSDAVYGLGAGIFFLGYFLFQLPSNLILQQVGPRRWICVIMIFWGLVSCSMMLVSSPYGFYLLRFVLGAAEAGFFPGVILYLNRWFPSAFRAHIFAIFATASPIAGIIGGPISGALLNLDRLRGLAGWQWLFLLEGLPAIVLGVVVYFVLSDWPSDARWLAPEQRQWLVDKLRSEESELTGSSSAGVFAAFGIGKVWMLAFVYFSLNMTAYGINLWLPTVLHRVSSFGNVGLGFLTTIPYLFTVIVMLLNGYHSDRTQERYWHVAIPAFAAAVALAGAGRSGRVAVLVACFSVAFAGVLAMNGPFWAISSRMFSGAAAPAGIALINSVGNLGSGLGPYLIGFVSNRTGSFQLPLLLVGCVGVLGGFTVLAVRSLAARK